MNPASYTFAFDLATGRPLNRFYQLQHGGCPDVFLFFHPSDCQDVPARQLGLVVDSATNWHRLGIRAVRRRRMHLIGRWPAKRKGKRR